MSADNEPARQLTHSLLTALAGPIESLSGLRALLRPVLACFQLAVATTKAVPPSEWDNLTHEQRQYILRTSFGDIQRVLATKIIVDWHAQLDREDLVDTLWKPFFVPWASATSGSQRYAAQVALSTYPVLLQVLANKPLHPLVRQLALKTLADLTHAYNVRSTYAYYFAKRSPGHDGLALLDWQSFVNLYISIPSRIANLASTSTEELDTRLEWRSFFSRLSGDVEILFGDTAASGLDTTSPTAFEYLLSKLARSGFCQPFLAGQLSFWPAIWRPLQLRLVTTSPQSSAWPVVMSNLTSSDLATLAIGFFVQCQAVLAVDRGPAEEDKRRIINRLALLARAIFGSLEGSTCQSESLWDVVVQPILLERPGWSEDIGRLLVAWAALSDMETAPNATQEAKFIARTKLLDGTMKTWADRSVIDNGTEAHHLYLSKIIVLLLTDLPDLHSSIVSLSLSPMFLTSISTHLASLRPSIRYKGMFIAELVSRKSRDPGGSVKPLDFGDLWQEAEARNAVSRLRDLSEGPKDWHAEGWEMPIEGEAEVEGADDTAETEVNSAVQAARLPSMSATPRRNGKQAANGKIQVLSSSTSDDESALADEYNEYDSAAEDEDDLVPYTLPAAPRAEDLKDLEDPSAYTPNKKKVQPPVYIADLSAMLKDGKDADRLEMGLREAEGLIRRKAGWGSELEDNAVDLAFTLSGLQDNFSTADFEELRRNALTALLVACPTRSAPPLIEQYFSNQYSISQKFAMLSSLAISSRELAGLPSILPASAAAHSAPRVRQATEAESFPSQRLPGRLHEHFLSVPKSTSAQVNSRPNEEASSNANAVAIEAIAGRVTDLALSSTRESAQETVPGASKEQLLTVRAVPGRTKILKPISLAKSSILASPEGILPNGRKPKFADIGAETFILPLINRFWLYMRDVATSPQQTLRGAGPYAGGLSGAPAVLESLLLSKFLNTLGVLLDAGRNSPHFLAVLAPESLELVLAVSRGAASSAQVSPEVQKAGMQTALIVLDGSIAIDGGSTLARDFGKLTWSTKAWAEKAWEEVERKGDSPGASGRAAAGLLLRLDEVQRKMIGYR